MKREFDEKYDPLCRRCSNFVFVVIKQKDGRDTKRIKCLIHPGMFDGLVFGHYMSEDMKAVEDAYDIPNVTKCNRFSDENQSERAEPIDGIRGLCTDLIRVLPCRHFDKVSQTCTLCDLRPK